MSIILTSEQEGYGLCLQPSWVNIDRQVQTTETLFGVVRKVYERFLFTKAKEEKQF